MDEVYRGWAGWEGGGVGVGGGWASQRRVGRHAHQQQFDTPKQPY